MSSGTPIVAAAAAATPAFGPPADQPTATQLLFARAVILTMELWPVMRLAVSEQWGGHESREKRDFLVSYLCDEYSSEPSAVEPPSSSSSGGTAAAAPRAPDVDDLADTLQMYFDDEFESRIEDGSAEWIAGRIVHMHRAVYAAFPPTEQSLAAAQAEVDKLAAAAQRLRGTKIEAQQSQAPADEGHTSASGSDDDGNGDANSIDAMEVDGPAPSASSRNHAANFEPVVDEDGFTTVVKGRRR